MDPTILAIILAIGLFIGTLACLEVGYRLAERKSAHPELRHEGIGPVEAAVFALLGLLLAFAFAGGTELLNYRRQLIVDEANAIGTAYLRLDLLRAEDQPELRRLFRLYLEERLEAYQALPDVKAAQALFTRATTVQRQIWSSVVNSTRSDPRERIAELLLPAVNNMIDVTTSRTVAMHTHVPLLIFALLVGVALVSGLLAGYAMSKRHSRSWLHMMVYALVVSITIYTVADLDYPRTGLIRLTAADGALLQLRDSIR